jgi:hypothetical protein
MKLQAIVFMLLGYGALLPAQDLSIDYRFDVSGRAEGNYLSYTSAIRYIAADKDSFDTISGASCCFPCRLTRYAGRIISMCTKRGPSLPPA